MFYKYFKNKKVLITGHTGFKGSWLSFWLHKLGAKVVGVSNNVSYPSNFNGLTFILIGSNPTSSNSNHNYQLS